MMTSKRNKIIYPDHLNPFGSEDEPNQDDASPQSPVIKLDEYPDYLSPFGDEENDATNEIEIAQDYDESLNPFGDDEPQIDEVSKNNEIQQVPQVEISQPIVNDDDRLGTPFDDDYDVSIKQPLEFPQESNVNSITHKEPRKTITPDSQLESLDCPPIPLPRTKSLLKKELARKSKLENLDNHSTSSSGNNIQSGSVIQENDNRNSVSSLQDRLASFQKRKNKRNAPPVPINFKRQVSGSLTEIEDELNIMGDQLQAVEQDFITCQDNLKSSFDTDTEKFMQSRDQMMEVLERKNSILRRQKELMYRKRELKLDQIHSDIEYELRMIGNKQVSTRTLEDHTREKELLTKLVEIVEEKSDIVENLNKEANCDTLTLDDIFKRLEINESGSSSQPGSKLQLENHEHQYHSAPSPDKNKPKRETCDKTTTLAIGVKMSKIATLIPNKGTIKGTFKNAKRKHLFPKKQSKEATSNSVE